MALARLFAPALLALCLAWLPAHAADIAGAKDHPLITRFAGAEITHHQVQDFDEVVMPRQPLPPGSKLDDDKLLKAEGRVTRIAYRVPEGKTVVEVMRNYEQALGNGFETVFKCAEQACGLYMSSAIALRVQPNGWPMVFDKNRYLLARRNGPAGEVFVMLYVMQEHSYPVQVYQQVVEVKPMQSGQVAVLDAKALKQGLEADGKVAVYGIYFDTGRAEVKPESKPTLDQMAKLLAANAALKVYIVGHTDNAGTLAANLDLSQRRADAVVKTLVSGYKLDATRLLAKGVASLAPVASNAAEAGRARNRRVELVLQ